MADQTKSQADTEEKGEAQKLEEAAERAKDAERPARQTREQKAAAEAGEGDGRRRSYSRDRLIESGQDLIGHPSHVVAGALEDSDQEEFTVAQATSRVEKFLNRPVSTGEEA